jgi:hypothetical protein
MGMTPVSSINFPAALASSESEDAGEARGDADGGRGDKDDRSRDDKDDRSRDDKDDQSKASASHRREFSENQDRIKESTEEHPGYIYSDQLLNFDHTSGDSILLQAETAKRHGDLEKAITLARKSLDMAPGCLDAHAFYAEVLESKLRKQTERDPEMFETCVKEWLIVLRNKVGDEAGMNAHGIAVPFIGTFFEDEEHTIKARQHLIKLTGAAPKGWETDNKYLKKVLTASRESVSGKVVKQKKPKDEFKEELKDEFKGKDEFK